MADTLLAINNSIDELNYKLENSIELTYRDKALLNLLTADFDIFYNNQKYGNPEAAKRLKKYTANKNVEGLNFVDSNSQTLKSQAIVGSIKRACVISSQVTATVLVGFSFIFANTELIDEVRNVDNFVEYLCTKKSFDYILQLLEDSIPKFYYQPVVEVSSAEDILKLYEDTMYGIIYVNDHYLIFAPKCVINGGIRETIIICYTVDVVNRTIYEVDLLSTLDMYLL